MLVRIYKEDLIAGINAKIEELKSENITQYNDSKRLLDGEGKEKECFLNRINEEYNYKIEILRKKKIIIEKTEYQYMTLDEILNSNVFKDEF